MALIADVVTRTDDAAGDEFLTFIDGLARRVQGVAIVNLNSDPMGVTGTPLVVSVTNNVTLDDSTPINVNIASEAPATPYVVYGTSTAAVASAQISGSGPYMLKQLRVIMASTSTVDRYLMLFNGNGVSAGQTLADFNDPNVVAPVWRAFLPAGVETSETFDDNELIFSNGLLACISSTEDSLTLTGAEAYFHAIGI